MISVENLTVVRWVVAITGLLLSAWCAYIVYRRETGGFKGAAGAFFIVSLGLLLVTFLGTTLSDYQDTLERQRLSEEAQRPLEKIAGLRASADIVINGRLPGLEAYRRRLESSGCLPPGDDQGPGTFLEKDCLPDRVTEPSAEGLLGYVVLDVEVLRHRPGSSGCGDDGVKDTSSDISTRFSATISEGTLRLAYNRQAEEFTLRTEERECLIEDFKLASGELATAGSLASARMLVRFRSFTIGGNDVVALYKALRLENLRFRFTGPRPVDAPEGFHEINRVPPEYIVCMDEKG
jgi:hypothetical protein